MMRRVFYLITELDAGGAEKALYELATRLDRRRFEVMVGCLTGRGAVGEQLLAAGVDVRYFEMRGWWDAAAWLRVREALREFRPHVLHAFLFHANLVSRVAAMGLGVEEVISSVRVEEPRRSHLWLDRLTRRLVDRVTCVSVSTRDYTRRMARIPPEKLVVISNGVDAEQWRVSLMAPPAEWRLPDGAPVVGVIGRLHEQKDPETMLAAAERVVSGVPDAVFAFAGEGPLAERCRATANLRGLDENVRWLGRLSDVRPLLSRIDLLALSARWEGMPNVVLEAMACGKPVVATRAGGTPEIVHDGVTGFLVPVGDADALAARIVELLADAALRERLGKAGLKRVKEHFSIRKMVAANEALYEAARPENGAGTP